MMEETYDLLWESILDGDTEATASLTRRALDDGALPDDILNVGMIPAMAEVGRLFEAGEAFIPEMLIAAGSMKAGLAILEPHLAASEVEPAGTVLIGTVAGDMHDIGKNLVGMMLEGAGFQVKDIGVDVSAKAFADAVSADPSIDVVAVSAMLTTTMAYMSEVVSAFKEEDLYDKVSIIVGGAPTNPEFAAAIGAHGYAKDAGQAVRLVRSLVGGSAA